MTTQIIESFLSVSNQHSFFSRIENFSSIKKSLTFFLPFNPKNKQLFLAHHKKSGLWIAPGGHIDKGEILLETLNREIWEELGVKDHFKEAPNPFLLTITRINNTTQPCKTHYDIWYLMTTDGANFNVDPQEFYSTKWLSIDEARKIVTAPTNIAALKMLC